MRYCESPYFYQRRKTREVVVGDPAHGGVIIGGDHPVVMQSMITCDTMDTAECVQANAGTRRRRLPDRAHHRAHGQGRGQPARTSSPNCAARTVASCRLSPTFISSPTPPWKPPNGSRWCASIPAITPTRRNLPIKEYTDEQYAAELKRIEEKFTPLVEALPGIGPRPAHRHQPRLAQRPHHEPLRRHAARHGGERAGIRPHRAAQHDFHNFKFSMKSSNPKVMIECYRLLVARLEQDGAGLELSDSSRRHRSGRRRGRPHQERHRHRLAAVRRPGRHHPRFAHRRFAARNRGLHAICWRRFPLLDATSGTSESAGQSRISVRSVPFRAPRNAGD